MKPIFLAMMTVATLAACASDYVMSTKAGTIIETRGKPYLDEATGTYKYETKDGRSGSIKKEEVIQILER